MLSSLKYPFVFAVKTILVQSGGGGRILGGRTRGEWCGSDRLPLMSRNLKRDQWACQPPGVFEGELTPGQILSLLNCLKDARLELLRTQSKRQGATQASHIQLKQEKLQPWNLGTLNQTSQCGWDLNPLESLISLSQNLSTGSNLSSFYHRR